MRTTECLPVIPEMVTYTIHLNDLSMVLACLLKCCCLSLFDNNNKSLFRTRSTTVT